MGKYFLYLSPEAPEKVSWVNLPEYGSPTIGQGSLDDAASILQDQEVIAIIPGPEVLHTEVTIPKHHHRILIESIPYLLEENLAEDVETLHFASGSPDKEGVGPVAVVSRKRMDFWLALLKDSGITVKRLVPAGLAVPFSPDQWSLVINGDQFLLRQGTWQVWAGDSPDLHRYLGSDGDQHNKVKVQLFSDSPDHDLDGLPPNLEITSTIEKSLIETLAEGYSEEGSLDLMQGNYSHRAQWRKLWLKWRLSLIAAAVICLLSITGFLFEYFALKSANNDLDRQIKAVYLETFPDSRGKGDPRMLMESKLAGLQKTAGRRGNFFLLYDKTSQLLASTPGFSLNILRFKDNRFEFDIEVSDLQTLDKLKQQLGGVHDVSVEIKNAESSGSHVNAKLQIMPGGTK